MFLKPNSILLAPLAGITDPVYRRICKRLGADAVVTEMVSADGLHYKSANTARLMEFDESERPIGVQFFGSDPERLANAAKFAYDRINPDFIDLNAGCPVAKVVKNGSGSALMKTPDLFGKIIEAMSKAVPTPVTVKIRSGWNMHDWVDVELAKIAQESGAAAVTLHPRSQTMMFTGHSFWERIAIVKQAVSIPIIGNGDITSGADAVKMFNETNCDAVMVGRGSLGNPWIFAEIKSTLQGKTFIAPSRQERKELIIDHIRSFRDLHGEQRAYGEMKKCVAWYLKGLPGASAARAEVFAASSSIRIEEIVDKFLM